MMVFLLKSYLVLLDFVHQRVDKTVLRKRSILVMELLLNLNALHEYRGTKKQSLSEHTATDTEYNVHIFTQVLVQILIETFE